MPTPIYDTGDPGDVVGTPPPPAGSPPPGGDGGSPPPPGGSGHQKHPVQPKKAPEGGGGAVGGWRHDGQTAAFGAATKAHPTELLTEHSRAKVVAEPLHSSIASSPGAPRREASVSAKAAGGFPLTPQQVRHALDEGRIASEPSRRNSSTRYYYPFDRHLQLGRVDAGIDSKFAHHGPIFAIGASVVTKVDRAGTHAWGGLGAVYFSLCTR